MNKSGLPTGKHTLIEEGTELKGSVSSNCPIVVVGKIEGDVTGPMIHISPTGVVAGKVNVKQLRSEGELAGEVEAEVVHIAGSVRDKTRIRARSLEVTLATKKGMEVVFGECELAIGDEPDKHAAIAAATAAPTPAMQPGQEVTAVGPPVSDEPPKSVADEQPNGRKRGHTQPPPL